MPLWNNSLNGKGRSNKMSRSKLLENSPIYSQLTNFYNTLFALAWQKVYCGNLANSLPIAAKSHHYFRMEIKQTNYILINWFKRASNTRVVEQHNLPCMIEVLCAVIDHRHDVWIIVFIVIIERVKEDSQTRPEIWTTENGAIVGSFVARVPECQTIRSYPSTSAYSEYYFYLPPVESRWLFHPYCT